MSASAASRGAHPTRRLGLRARVTAAFALGALFLSVLLSVAAHGLVRENFVSQRETTATDQAFANARGLRDLLRGAEGEQNTTAMESVAPSGGATPMLYRDEQWYTPGSVSEPPQALRNAVLDGNAARMRYTVSGNDEVFFAVGVPIASVDAYYFEISSLDDLDGSLTQIVVTLAAAGFVTTLAGAAIGASASRRVLRPLANVSAAAVAIAGGRLDTRLAPIEDPDLGTLVTSFNDMATALQDRIERDARFASDVSHELRSPLTTLTASIEVLQGRREDMPERAQFALDLLVSDVQRFSAMVEDLLEISRFDAGAAHLELDEVVVAELVRHAVAAVAGPEVPLHVGPGAETCVAEVDKRRIVRVLANLLGNAQKYAGGATAVGVERGDEGDVLITVEDEGPGVEPGDRQRIFERFSRAASAAGQRGSSDGVGLGLALVREHINLHGGAVWVEARPDGRPGARFVVELPATTPSTVGDLADLGEATVPAEEMVT
jgi:two-component system, OmpR family, sensor histidine kinase MtrB